MRIAFGIIGKCIQGLILLLACESVFGRSVDSKVEGPSVAVSKVASRYGFSSYDVHGKQITLQGRFNMLEMEGNSRRASFNHVDFWLSGPPARSWGRWTMLQNDVDKMLAPLLNPSEAVKKEGYRVIVLDPGHGGNDKGANNMRRGIQEKQIVLELAKDVRGILKRYNLDVRLTRWQDVNLSLDERSQYAAQVRADLFVSIHLNSANSSKPSGIETHIMPLAGYPITANASVSSRDRVAFPGNRHDEANMVLGYMLQKSLLKYTRAEDRGVRRSRFYVIKCAPCPAALVECGFISNCKEREKLMQTEYKDRIAKALAEGIIAYLNTVKRAHNIKP
ncbi:MAG: N-acetylmuramoyl-L-alanine amidase [Verrucomicrobia bacterium]|nr:N-acetylmuramoyl-L-alanine amidase [Verrucomicrobiota bacterium]MBU1733934.1 N-acetylmuramoyl-L-alanine amidase [Verrucomicrobiota bacterium]MBU1857288.1 N-acetylmuramoyl-L-alanine amidase [Verrucomicrobiota bacterium]